MMNFKQFLPKAAVLVDGYYYLNFVGDSNCVYSGTCLGEFEDGELIPTLSFIELIASKFGEIVLNKKNSWLFSCNRIVTDPVKDSDSKIVVVRNGYNEILGVAKKVDTKFIPVWDIGHLLRRELD